MWGASLAPSALPIGADLAIADEATETEAATDAAQTEAASEAAPADGEAAPADKPASAEDEAAPAEGETAGSQEAAGTASAFVDQLGLKSGFPTDGRFVDGITALPDFYESVTKDAANAEANPPRRYVDRNGFTVQPVPADPIGFNESYLNADNRGCTSCHTMENALMSLPTYHRLIFFGYPTEQTYENCVACHSDSYSGEHLADSIHVLHLGKDMFENQDGTCLSCHDINYKTGVFERWDEVKYDKYHGFVEVSADDAGLDVTYDQTTITPRENWFFKSIKDEPSEWLTDDSEVDPSIYENWVISVGGDCENPFEMTLPEMVDEFGTVTQVMKNDCTINGPGQATIMQVEVEGIPVEKIIEYAKPSEGANILSPISTDGYNYAQMSLDWLIDNKAIIVTKMAGETLANSQGYPCVMYVYKTSGGNFVKRISNLTFMTVEEDAINSQLYVGQFTDDRTGEIYSKPNAGVLNYPTGVVLSGEEAETVHLEGFADAWDEPITSIRYSLDRGKTWTEVDTVDNSADYWTYWRLDFVPPEPGSYLLKIATTSETPDGEQRECQYDTNFMFTVE